MDITQIQTVCVPWRLAKDTLLQYESTCLIHRPLKDVAIVLKVQVANSWNRIVD